MKKNLTTALQQSIQAEKTLVSLQQQSILNTPSIANNTDSDDHEVKQVLANMKQKQDNDIQQTTLPQDIDTTTEYIMENSSNLSINTPKTLLEHIIESTIEHSNLWVDHLHNLTRTTNLLEWLQLNNDFIYTISDKNQQFIQESTAIIYRK